MVTRIPFRQGESKRHVVSDVVLTSLFLLPAVPARADGFVSPTVGVDFGGNAGSTLRGAVNSQKVNVGVAVGWMSAGVFGLEEDFSWAPNFFGSGGTLIDKTRVVTLMTNVIAGVPVGGQKGGGVGDFSQNDFGFDVGGGVMGYFADHIGPRGDVRYFRSFQDTEANVVGLEVGRFAFYRASVGVLFRF